MLPVSLKLPKPFFLVLNWGYPSLPFHFPCFLRAHRRKKWVKAASFRSPERRCWSEGGFHSSVSRTSVLHSSAVVKGNRRIHMGTKGSILSIYRTRRHGLNRAGVDSHEHEGVS
jgi:hypothetical protein